jgi:chorismate lyase/3-hydroxybenzoate synthase
MTAPVLHARRGTSANDAHVSPAAPQPGANVAHLWTVRGPSLSPSPQRLGRLCLGAHAVEPTDLAPILPVLDEPTHLVDAWCTPGPYAQGRTGALHWRHGADWLFGALQVEEDEDDPQSLREQVQSAYLDLFQALRDTGFAHPVRLWNYIPRINEVEDGLERYRRFNIGRQQAFMQAGQAAFDGAPAACALGTRTGPLCIGVLASRSAPVPLENPRQVSAYRYPNEYGPRAPTFSRAALADIGAGRRGLWLSGTASIVGHATVHAGDPRAQTHETLTNIETLLDVAAASGTRLGTDDLVLNVYVRHAGDAESVRDVMALRWGARAPALAHASFHQADICRADLLVEIEGHAVAGPSPSGP